MNLTRGTKLGPYEIVSLIGAGGMGEVYRARDTRLGRDVAVKVLPAEFADHPERVRRFELEARAVAALNHPNILTLYDIGTQEGAPYLVTELLEGESLREMLMEGALPVRKAIDIGAQVAEGLAAAHEKGIVHRDLKPGNVFVTRDGRAKILDFGLARLVKGEADSAPDSAAPTAEQGTKPGAVLGTIGYMSPEQVKGKPADARSDIFALGVMLYEMLSGERPFQGDSEAEVMTAILKEDPSPLAKKDLSIPPMLERTVAHCLEKNPNRRFQSARDVAFALESATSSSSTDVSLPPLPEEKRMRLLKRSLAGLVLGAVAVALLSAGGLWGKHEYEKPIPSYKPLTFRRGLVTSARFSPDGNTVYFSAAWGGGPLEVFAKRLDTVESQAMALKGMDLASVSLGEMAVLLDAPVDIWKPPAYTLARVPLSGGKPREIMENVKSADYAPGTTALAVSHLVKEKCRIEYPLGKVLYESGGELLNLRFSPFGDKLAFIENAAQNNYVTAGFVAYVDLDGKRRRLTDTWVRVDGLAWRPDGGEIWFAASPKRGEYALYAVDLSGHLRMVSRTLGDQMLWDMADDGRVLMSQEIVRRESRGLVSGMDHEQDLNWLDGTRVWDISEDGQTMIFGENREGGGPKGSVYLQRMDGSPPVRLGDGKMGSLSPDGKWVLTYDDAAYRLLPTGPGEQVVLPAGTVKHRMACCWLPKGKRFMCCATEEGRLWRLWVQSVPDGLPRPFTPEGYSSFYDSVSPDERYVAVGPVDLQAEAIYTQYPIDGGDPVPILGIKAGEHPVRYSQDGRFMYVREHDAGIAAPICKLDLRTGRRNSWKVLCPADPSGVRGIERIKITSDGRFYAYAFTRQLSELFLAEGLK